MGGRGAPDGDPNHLPPPKMLMQGKKWRIQGKATNPHVTVTVRIWGQSHHFPANTLTCGFSNLLSKIDAGNFSTLLQCQNLPASFL